MSTQKWVYRSDAPSINRVLFNVLSTALIMINVAFLVYFIAGEVGLLKYEYLFLLYEVEAKILIGCGLLCMGVLVFILGYGIVAAHQSHYEAVKIFTVSFLVSIVLNIVCVSSITIFHNDIYVASSNRTQIALTMVSDIDGVTPDVWISFQRFKNCCGISFDSENRFPNTYSSGDLCQENQLALRNIQCEDFTSVDECEEAFLRQNNLSNDFFCLDKLTSNYDYKLRVLIVVFSVNLSIQVVIIFCLRKLMKEVTKLKKRAENFAIEKYLNELRLETSPSNLPEGPTIASSQNIATDRSAMTTSISSGAFSKASQLSQPAEYQHTRSEKMTTFLEEIRKSSTHGERG